MADEVAYALFGMLAIGILLQIILFAAGKEQIRLISNKALCLEEQVDRLARAVKTISETLRGLNAERSARPRQGTSRKRAGDGGENMQDEANTRDDAGVSEPPTSPIYKETKPESESESESDSERAARLQSKSWLQAGRQLPETAVGGAPLKMGGTGRNPDVRRSDTDLSIKTRAPSRINMPSTVGLSRRRTAPHEDAPPTEGSSMAPARTDTNRQATTTRHLDFTTAAPSTSLLSPSNAPPPLCARKTAAAKDATAKTSSGSRFYENVIEKRHGKSTRER